MLYPSVWQAVSKVDTETVKAIEELLMRLRANGYTVSELEANGLKMKLQYVHDEPLSPGERLQMRRASQDSYGARTAQLLSITDDGVR